MARRSDHNREELYNLALSAAADIVSADGIRGLTARNVADRIGYSAGTLYNLFENLDDIIVHLNGRTLDSLNDSVSAAPITGDVAKDLSSLAHIYLQYLNDHPNLWSALFDHRLPDGQVAPEWYATKVTLVLSVVEAALTPLFDSKQSAEKENAARVLWASVHGICSLAQSGKLQTVTTQNAKQMTDVLITNFVAGLTSRGQDGDR